MDRPNSLVPSGRIRSRFIFPLVATGLLFTGCGPRTPPVATTPDEPLAVAKVGPQGSTLELAPGQPIPQISYSVRGAPGFAKQIVEVSGTSESKNAGPFLYDTLFRAQGEGTLSFEILPNPSDATDPSQAKVRLAASSAREESSASYNPRLWFGPGHEQTRIRITFLDPSRDRPLSIGEEIPLVEIVANPSAPDARPIRLTWKVQFNDNPSAPRLKAKRK